MSIPKKKWLQGILLAPFLAAVVVFANGCVGWASSASPPRLSATERARRKGVHLPLTVGVEQCEFPVYSDALVKALRRTDLFAHVDHLQRFSSPPALVARVERHIYGSTAIPIFTLLTFGVIPTFTEEESGYSFSLRLSASATNNIPIEYSYRGRTTLGWIAILDCVVPGRTVFPFDPLKSQQFRDGLSLAILEHADEITKLAETEMRPKRMK